MECLIINDLEGGSRDVKKETMEQCMPFFLKYFNVCICKSFCRQAWDLAVDICLSQLPTIIEEGTAFRVSWPSY